MARILQIHTYYREQGGEDSVVEGERELLQQGGHDVLAFRTENAKHPARAAVELLGYTYNPVAVGRIRRVIRRWQPEVAHIHNTWFALSPSILRPLQHAGVRTVMTLHNYRLRCANSQLLRDGHPCELCVQGSTWNAVRYSCYRGNRTTSAIAAGNISLHDALGTWRKHVGRFIVFTEFARSIFERCGIPSEQLAVVPNFVADPGPRPAPPSQSDYVLYAGRLSPEKGLAAAVRAWGEVEPPGLRLLIAGDGPERRQLEALAGSAVEFIGRLPREDVTRLMLSARTVLYPSIWYEGQPMTVLEAFAAGTPVIGSRLGGLGETVAALGDDWSTPPGDRKAFGQALARLSDDSVIDSAGAQARTSYEHRHAPALAIARLERVYEGLAGGH